MIQHGLLQCFTELLDKVLAPIIELLLEGYYHILVGGATASQDKNFPENPFLDEIQKVDAVKKIKRLLFHYSYQVRFKAHRILENYFRDELEN